jgi:hypothetical protein
MQRNSGLNFSVVSSSSGFIYLIDVHHLPKMSISHGVTGPVKFLKRNKKGLLNIVPFWKLITAELLIDSFIVLMVSDRVF